MNTPRVSVIMPVYNGEKTIRESIESALNQTFADFELLVINDGSQDSTLDILDDIQDPRMKVFSYPNTGVSASRNRGIALARGEFVAFLDADDLWTPDKLDTQLKVLEANPQAMLAYSWATLIDESNQPLGIGHRTTAENAFVELLAGNCIEGSGSNPLIYKRAFDELGGFEETITHGEDWDMWLRLAAHYQFVVIPHPLVLYRITNYSATSKISHLESGLLGVLERAYTQAPESLQHIKKQAYVWIYTYLSWRTLNGPPGRQKGLVAAKYLWFAIKYKPSLLLKMRYILASLFKILVTVLLPSKQSMVLLAKIVAIRNSNLASHFDKEACE